MRELLKRVLNARTIGYPLPPSLVKDVEAELAKPDPEPVAYLTIDASGKEHVHLGRMSDSTLKDWNIKKQMPLHTHPQAQQKPLSEDEIKRLWEESLLNTNSFTLKFARAIEAAHGIK